MKVTITPDGSVELEVHNGEGQVALDLIRSLTAPEQPASSTVDLGTLVHTLHKLEPTPDPSVEILAKLSPVLRSAMEVLLAYPDGCHYTVVAELLGIAITAANSRCQELRKRGLATWVASGVYAPTVESHA